MRGRGWWCVGIVAAVATYACLDAERAAPFGLDGTPTFDVTSGPVTGGGAPGSFGGGGLPTPPTNLVTTGWVNVGTIPAGFTARVKVEGKLTFTPNASYQLCAGSAPPPLPGGLSSVGPAGFPNGYNSYAVLVEYAGTQPPQTGGHRLAPTDPTASVVTEIKQGPAVVWAWRPSVLPYACGSGGVTQPAYYVSGSQSVTLETLDSAYLRADRGEAYVGDVVTFTIVPPAWATSARAFGWRWVTVSSSAPVSGCGDALECRVPVVT